MKLASQLLLLPLTLALALALTTATQAGEKKKGTAKNPYTLTELVKGIDKLEKKKVVISSTVIGSCKSGCKMWVADGEYKEGDLFALVRAKDDAFKFDTNSAGKTASLHGFAVAKLMDYCAEGGEKEAEEKKECAGPGTPVKEITFFATKVNY